jgi:hypothetical protein
MRRMVWVPLILVSALAVAQTPEAATEAKKLDALGTDIRALSRVVDLSTKLEDNRQVLKAIVAAEIDMLREPREDGSYRWASLQREEDDRAKENRGVERVHSEETLDSATVSAPRAFRLIVSVPKKRNVVSANQRVFVKDAIVEWTSFDGKTRREELPIDVWVNPGDSHGVALPDIARSAKATVRMGVDSGKKKAEAEVILVQAKLVDDPNSPWFPAVSRLLNVQRLLKEENLRRGDIKSAIDEAQLALPGELQKRMADRDAAVAQREALASTGTMKGSIAVGDATPDIVTELAAIHRLSSGTVEEQTEARTRMERLIHQLTPKMDPGT